MEPAKSLILTLLIVVTLVAAGCTGEDTTPPDRVGISPPLPGVDLQIVGDVVGQGVILQGVPRGTIDTVTFPVGLAPGTNSVDLDKLVIVYADAVRTETLGTVPGVRQENPPPGNWSVIQVVNEKGSPNNRLEFDEQAIIRINTRAPIVPNQVITISVRAENGKPLTIRRVAPATILPEKNILGVL
jgi:archaellin